MNLVCSVIVLFLFLMSAFIAVIKPYNSFAIRLPINAIRVKV